MMEDEPDKITKKHIAMAEIISINISDICCILEANIFWCGTGNNSKLPCASANYIKPNLRVTRSRGFNASTDINNVRTQLEIHCKL